MVLNINQILQLFPTCLVHLTVYELSAVFPSQKFTFYSPDIHHFQNPIVLSRFFVNGSINFLDYFVCKLSEGSAGAFVFPPVVIRHTCGVQLHYNYDKIKTFYEGLPGLNGRISCGYTDFLPEDFKDLLFPRLICSGDEEEMCPYTLADAKAKHHTEFAKPHTLEKFNVYQILLSNDPVPNEEAVSDWAESVDLTLLGTRPEAVANHFLKLVITLLSPNDDVLGYFYVQKIYGGFQLISLGPIDINTHGVIDENYFKDESLMQTSHNFMLVNMNNNWKNDVDIGLQIWTHFRGKIGSARFTDFEPWMNQNYILLGMLLPNVSMNVSDESVSSGNACFEHSDASKLVVVEEGLQFVTCGGVEQGTLSLIGYTSAFDTWTWVVLTVFVIITACMRFWLKSTTAYFDGIALAVDVCLEQSNSVASNDKKQTYLYMLSGAWILVGIVMSNAYRGENITDLTQPIPPIKPNTFQDLIDNQFVVYSKSTDETVSDIINAVNYFASQLFLQRNNGSDEIKTGSVLAYILDFAEEESQATEYYRDILSLVYNFTFGEKADVAKAGLTGYIGKIKYCNKTAFMAWSRETQQAEQELKLTLLNESSLTEDKVNEITSSSKESLAITRKGWTFNEVVIPIKYLIGRINGLVESGIAKQWNHWDSWVRKSQFSGKFRKYSDKVPVKLTLNDNIVVVFYVHIFLISICMLVYLIEVDLVLLISSVLQRYVTTVVKSCERHLSWLKKLQRYPIFSLRRDCSNYKTG